MVEWSAGSSLEATATTEMAGAHRNRPATAKSTRGRERGGESWSESGSVGLTEPDRFGPGFDPLGLTCGPRGILDISQIPLIAKIHNFSFIAPKIIRKIFLES